MSFEQPYDGHEDDASTAPREHAGSVGRRAPVRARALPALSHTFPGLLTGLLLVTSSVLPKAVAGQAPDGRTAIADLGPAAIERGRRLYVGRAGCQNCHGRRGRGVRGMASSLVDREWIRVDGSPESLLDIVRSGLPAARSPTGIPMPPRGGARLTKAQMRAVVAYTLSLRDGG